MRWRLWAASALAVALAAGCGPKAETVLKVCHAGSLSVPFEKLEQAYEALHPDVDVRREVYGSAMAIRQVTELGKEVDVVASADYLLIDRMMIESSPRWAAWNALFARNAMCVAFGPHSVPLDATNWDCALQRDGVRIGISNPNHDPCGYRSLLTLYLAQSRLGKAGLFDNLILANSNLAVGRADGWTAVKVPSSVEFRAPLVMRPKETDLVALLQAGAIDYLFIYRSVAVEQGLEFLDLPPEVNLGDPAQESCYATAGVHLFADDPHRRVEVRGGAIVYGVTVPSSARNPELAAAFVRLLLSDEGARILRSCGQAPIRPVTYSPATVHSETPF